ncbi:MAG: DUF5916 domain-containing protein [Pseudomonadota bacterium]
MWVYIDSRRDARTAYFFAVNVKGVMGDGLMHDGMAVSYEWDENWEGHAALTAKGWSAEIRIPLRALRYTPDLPIQDWGLWASRFIALQQEKDDWPHISREVAAPIPFFGRLDELRDLRPGGTIQLRPFGVGQVRHRGAEAEVLAQGTDAAVSAGLDLKLHLTQSLTLDAAVNPDFAQVESDELVLNLNNYEIQYPEKRPLFLEGADLFATPLGAFYSRRIGSSPLTPTLKSGTGGVGTSGEKLVDLPGAATIYGAVKVSGRVGDVWTVGLLSALASRNEYDVQLESNLMRERRTVEPLTAYNVLRLRREIGDRAQVGGIFTSTSRFENTGGERACPTGTTAPAGARCFHDATVGGLDAIWRSRSADYLAAGQLIGSAISKGEPSVQLDGTSIGAGDRDVGGWLRLAKEGGRNFLAEVIYTGLGRKLTYNDLGFMPRQNLQEAKMGLELRSLVPGALTLERKIRLDLSTRRNLDGLHIGSLAELSATTRLQGFWTMRAALTAAPSYFDDREVGDGTALERTSLLGAKTEVASDPRRGWAVGMRGELLFRDGGTTVDLDVPLVLRTLPQFQIELKPQFQYNSGEYRFVSHGNSNAGVGPYVFARLLARRVGAIMRMSYSFTPRLSLQTFAQLFLSAIHNTDFREAPRAAGSRVRAGDLAPRLGAAPPDADSEEAALNINVVLRWEYRLGSTLFLVYSRSQIPTVVLGPSESATLRASAIGSAAAVDTVLFKLAFWWAS